MNQNLDFLKKELSLEIKEIAKEIANVESYTGLLTHEIKFRKLYDKFIVLKFLDKKNINIGDLSLPIEQPLSPFQEESIEEEVVLDLADDDESDNEFNNKLDEDFVEEIEEEEEVNLAIEEHKVEVDEIEEPSFASASTNHISPIKLDLNDKIAFKSQLFSGDSDSMDLVLKTLNKINDLPSSLQYLGELRQEMEWGSEVDEYLDRLKELILKRFNL